jgi:hypothetical protein
VVSVAWLENWRSVTSRKPKSGAKGGAKSVPRGAVKDGAKGTPKPKAAPKSGAKSAPKSGPKGGAKSASKATATAKTTAKAAPKSAPKASPKSVPKAAPAPRRTSQRAPRKKAPRAPLQRDSFGSRAARTLVLLLAFVCMVGFAAALAKATLVPSPGSSDLVHTNLRPGDSLRAYLDQPAIRDTVKQIGGNVLLGAPFGVLLPMLVPKARGAVRVVLVTSLVMVLVETAQGAIVEGRAFDVDDVILNTSGALLGYALIGRRLGHALHPRRHHWWQRRRRSA